MYSKLPHMYDEIKLLIEFLLTTIYCTRIWCMAVMVSLFVIFKLKLKS